MPQLISFEIDGGVNTEMGPSCGTRVKRSDGQATVLSVPWLIRADNAVLSLDGWPRKMPGATNVNSTATGATDYVTGIFDYWRSTTSGAPVQRKVIHSGSQIYSEDGSGTLTSIQTGLETGKMPWYEVMNDTLVIASSSNVDVPFSWNQTTFANLAGSPPNFAFHAQHKDRMWAAGVDSNKSRLYYSISGSTVDWTGAGSGSIDIAPDDGDVITGLISRHNKELIVYKGPNRLSIFRISGSAPTGADAFALQPITVGVGAVNQQSIVRGPGGDLWSWDDLGIHSLAVTEQYGDYKPEFLSAAISSRFNDELNHATFTNVWGVNFRNAGYALWTCGFNGSATHNYVVGLDYRFAPPRFFFWPAHALASLGMIRDTNRQTVPWGGTYTGRVRRMNQLGRDIAGGGYTMTVVLPYVGCGDVFFDKTFMRGRVSYAPKGATTFTVSWQRDNNTSQSDSITQSGTSTLGTSTDQFTLDNATSGVLGGGRNLPAFFGEDQGGDFKEIQFTISSSGTADVDCEPHDLGLEYEPAAAPSYVVPVG